MLIDTVISKVTHYSFIQISILGTLSTIAVSIPLVYICAFLFSQEYTQFLFAISVILPTLITPPVVILMLRLYKHLRHFKSELKLQIQKNKETDILLFEQARFVLMGEMMANISHQWKQPLNTIGLTIVNLRLADNEEARESHFDLMEDNIKYLASTIDDFMSFFDKKSSSELQKLDAIVHEVKSIINTHISNKNIDLEIVVDENYSKILIASSISQVVLNLLSNAKDAFENEDIKHKAIRLQFMSNEYGLEIECCDNGKGISTENRKKIFDPYFTTKEKSQGTGIGLYMSKEIIQKVFSGKINVSSRHSSRSELYPVDNSDKTCFYIAIPYSKNCTTAEGYE